MWVAFANAKATHIFFSKNISIYAIFSDQSFNNTLTNDIISVEQLGPGEHVFGNNSGIIVLISPQKHMLWAVVG